MQSAYGLHHHGQKGVFSKGNGEVVARAQCTLRTVDYVSDWREENQQNSLGIQGQENCGFGYQCVFRG